MANQNIRFALSSQFSGEGFQAATQAINANKKELNAAKAGLGELVNAFGEVSPAAAKGVSAVKSFTQAFVTGGIIGGAIQLAMKGIATAVEYYTEKQKAAEEAAKKYAEIMRGDIASSIDTANAKLKETSTEIDNANKEILDLVKTVNTGAAADVKFEIHQLHMDTLQKLTDETSEASRKIIQAQADYAEAEIKGKAAIEAATREREAQAQILHKTIAKREAAETAVAQTAEKLAQIQSECSGYVSTRENLEYALAVNTQRYNEGLMSLTDYNKLKQSITLQLNKLDEDHKEEKKMLIDAEKAAKDASDALTAAKKENEKQINALNEASDKEKIATNDLAEAKEKLKQKIDEYTDDYYNQFHNEGENAPETGPASDAPASEIKTAIEEVKEDTSSLKQNQNKFSGNVKVEIPGFTPGSLPTLDEIRQQREQLENAPAKMAEEASAKYGQAMTDYIRDLVQGRGQLSEEQLKEHADLIKATDQLPTDVVAKLMSGSAKRMLLKSDFADFFSDENALKDWIEKGRETRDEKIKSTEDNTKQCADSLSSIKSSLTKLGLK